MASKRPATSCRPPQRRRLISLSMSASDNPFLDPNRRIGTQTMLPLIEALWGNRGTTSHANEPPANAPLFANQEIPEMFHHRQLLPLMNEEQVPEMTEANMQGISQPQPTYPNQEIPEPFHHQQLMPMINTEQVPTMTASDMQEISMPQPPYSNQEIPSGEAGLPPQQGQRITEAPGPVTGEVGESSGPPTDKPIMTVKKFGEDRLIRLDWDCCQHSIYVTDGKSFQLSWSRK